MGGVFSNARSYTVNDPHDASSLGQPPTKTIIIMAKFAITSYRVTSRGIGLAGGDITPDTASDEFKWVTPKDKDFPAAVAAVKALKEGEEKREKDNMKLLEELL